MWVLNKELCGDPWEAWVKFKRELEDWALPWPDGWANKFLRTRYRCGF